MVEDWLALIGNMNGAVRELRQAAPDVMKTFSDMARAAHGGEALDGKTKELVALAIAVATHCAPCIPYHAEGAVKQGASRAAVAETLAMAVYMGAGPSVMYAAQALEAVDQITVVPHDSGGKPHKMCGSGSDTDVLLDVAPCGFMATV